MWAGFFRRSETVAAGRATRIAGGMGATVIAGRAIVEDEEAVAVFARCGIGIATSVICDIDADDDAKDDGLGIATDALAIAFAESIGAGTDAIGAVDVEDDVAVGIVASCGAAPSMRG
jgi:small ligand-binding sensory domain FIST